MISEKKPPNLKRKKKKTEKKSTISKDCGKRCNLPKCKTGNEEDLSEQMIKLCKWQWLRTFEK